MAVENDDSGEKPSRQKHRELGSFLFLTVVLAPAIAILSIGGYGLLIWIYQLIAGPPGPPGH